MHRPYQTRKQMSKEQSVILTLHEIGDSDFTGVSLCIEETKEVFQNWEEEDVEDEEKIWSNQSFFKSMTTEQIEFLKDLFDLKYKTEEPPLFTAGE
jgi:hypothetical protein